MSADMFLEQDIRRHGVELDTHEWIKIRGRASNIQVPPGQVIQNQLRVADSWIFVADGIVASKQTWTDGRTTIARFFEAGDICANLTSIWTQDIASDDLVAMTDLSCVAIPDEIFRVEFLKGGRFGEYLRLKMMAAHLFAKELICAQTSGRTEERYQFLLQHHSDVVGKVQKKDIASFLGITPQAFSRFQRRKNSSST